jgi:hypothetical protein
MDQLTERLLETPSFEEAITVRPNPKVHPALYDYRRGIQNMFTLGSTRGGPKVRCTFLIMCLFVLVFILNCSYGI